MERDAAMGAVGRHFEALMEIGERPVGSAAGARAEAYVEAALAVAGFETARAEYPCVDWRPGSCRLGSGGEELPASANPYSPPVRASGPALPVSSLEELEDAEIEGAMLVLGPELCGFPIMPKLFEYYNPEEHRRLVSLIEAGKPAAVLAVSPHARGVWNVFNDPDLGVASATVPSTAAPRLARGSRLELEIEAEARPSRAATVSGLLRRGPGVASGGRGRRLFCAHLDTKHYSPGALDNGASVAALLAAAELAASAAARGGGGAELEFVFYMGEECMAGGEKAWLAARGGAVGDIELAMNCDGAGGRPGPTSLCFFNFGEEEKAAVLGKARSVGGFDEMERWYESDHYLFWPAGIPTIAATSADPHRFDRLIHGPADLPGLVELGLVAELALLVAELARG
ncbi:MAG TPA: M28 family peptidase [Spirochaetales bacterium]|nr:M28 family peptidase [Spirochaetales bacterium]HRY55852.1 M28 family peptidase [Spirochaetia bacterium]HRZ65732.1 M28 family peptidase [Spirochaetia bacterium]